MPRYMGRSYALLKLFFLNPFLFHIVFRIKPV
jgi:hypothetical protein